MPKQAFLEAGQIVGTHGVRGEVRVQPWCDSPALFATLTTLYWDKAGASPVRVKSRPHKNIALAKLDGVDTVQDASALRGRLLYLARADLKLPAGRYFIKDGHCGRGQRPSLRHPDRRQRNRGQPRLSHGDGGWA